MKKLMIVVMILAVGIMGITSVWAEGNMFEGSHNDANVLKQEQLAARKYKEAENKTTEEKMVFDNTHNDANALKQEQLDARKSSLEASSNNEKVMVDNTHSSSDALKAEQIATRKYFENKEKVIPFEDAHANANTMKQVQLAKS